ncbi:hypothetical protein [Erythrobacter sp. Alg231-14]|uniref:hypothetical protein n=1 Tax=Erythrobacter sp. Alg231-14 TaxID=1922225 RepID=UPI000D55F8EE
MFAKIVWLSLVAIASIDADDRFNCPPPLGQIHVDENALFRAYPSHPDRVLPQPLAVDYVCAVDASGRFIRCEFATRHDLTQTQDQLVTRMMPRIMRALRSDKPNQECVASTVTLNQGQSAQASETTPNEPAG